MWRYPALNLRGDTSARDRATARLEGIEPDALLLTSDDAPTFGTWYVQTALGVRQDVVVVDVRLLDRPWYVAQLRRRLNLSAATPLCDALRGSDRPVYAVDQNGSAMTQTNGIWSGDSRAVRLKAKGGGTRPPPVEKVRRLVDGFGDSQQTLGLREFTVDDDLVANARN